MSSDVYARPLDRPLGLGGLGVVSTRMTSYSHELETTYLGGCAGSQRGAAYQAKRLLLSAMNAKNSKAPEGVGLHIHAQFPSPMRESIHYSRLLHRRSVTTPVVDAGQRQPHLRDNTRASSKHITKGSAR